MGRYRISRRAQHDLREIVRYIGQDNLVAAERVGQVILDAFEKLGDNPHLGQQRDDLTTLPLRFWPVMKNYMIVYDAGTTPVSIVRVYNAARDVNGLLL